MGFGVRNASERTVVVSAAEDVVGCLFLVNFIEGSEKVEAGDSDVGEASVDLSPFIAEEGAVGLLEVADVLDDFTGVDLAGWRQRYFRWL